jgi:hypothetical protein
MYWPLDIFQYLQASTPAYDVDVYTLIKCGCSNPFMINLSLSGIKMNTLETAEIVGLGLLISLVKLNGFYYFLASSSEEPFIKDVSILTKVLAFCI